MFLSLFSSMAFFDTVFLLLLFVVSALSSLLFGWALISGRGLSFVRVEVCQHTIMSLHPIKQAKRPVNICVKLYSITGMSALKWSYSFPAKRHGNIIMLVFVHGNRSNFTSTLLIMLLRSFLVFGQTSTRLTLTVSHIRSNHCSKSQQSVVFNRSTTISFLKSPNEPINDTNNVLCVCLQPSAVK